ncbi:MAG TPA: TonB-dependent receptor [Acidobacteriaceae bacterium]|nr:TonB-dependent receptor [Acidobacteriaceae bacterium]
MRTHRIARGLFVLLIAGMIAQIQLWSQAGTGIIFGTVTDPSGAVVGSADVSATNEATGVAEKVKSDQAGNYIFNDLRAAAYRITCEAPGFRTIERSGIVLQVDQRARVDLAMEVGQAQQVVSVQANATNVDTFSSTVKDVVDSTRMVELPLNGRNALSLQALLPGAVPMGTNSAASGIALNTNLVFSVNGARPNQSAYTLDGGLNMDTYNNVPAAFPNPDMLQEFSILQNSYSAVAGRDAGAVINMITKSGTNELHGTLYEFLRNDYADAKDYFATTVPPLKRNQFGGTIGGPVRFPGYNGRDKTFFFVGAELTRQVLGSTISSTIVPTALERSGNFSQTFVRGKPITVAPPSTVTASNPSGTPFPGNIIPAAYLDPVAQTFTNHFLPLPNQPGNIYAFNLSLPTRENQVIAKVDQNFSSHDQLSFRYFFDDSFNAQNAGLPAFNSNNDWPTHNGTINETHTFTSSLLNLATFMVARNTFIRGPQVTSPANWAALGCVSCVPLAPPDIPTDWSVTAANGLSLRVPTNFRSYMMNYQYIDTVSWSKHNHLFQMGGEISKERRYGREYFQFSPQYSFTGTLSGPYGAGYADFFLGAANSVFQNTPLESYQYKYTPFLYFSDDWRVSTKLTLNLGVRWEPYITTRDALGHEGAFRPGQQSVIYPLAPVGALFPGDAGIGPGVTPNRYDRFSPRIGFAYDPFGNGKTSIRGAYGIFSDTLRPVALNTNAINQPFSYGQTTFNVPLSDPYRNNPTTQQLLLAYVPPKTAAERAARVFYLPMTENTIDPRFTTGYIQQWNLTLQREVWKKVVLTAAYLGSKGTHLLLLEEENPAVYIPNNSTTVNVNSRRPFKNFQTITNDTSAGPSAYNSLQISWNRQFSGGFTLLGSYVYAKSMDIASNDGNSGLGNQARDPYNYSLDYGPSDFDIKHRFVTSFVYRIPAFSSGSSLMRSITGGWQLDGILTLQTGLPFSVRAGVDRSLVGVNSDNADVHGPVAVYNGRSRRSKIAEYFDTSAFSLPALGTFGTSSRNMIYGPGYENFDAGLFKVVPIHEQSRVELRWETFNSLNHPNFLNPNNSFTSSAFGRITSSNSGRVMQIAAKLIF